MLQVVPSAQRFYDINLRDDNWKLTAIEQLSSEATVVKLNDWEAECLDATFDLEESRDLLEGFARIWADRFGPQVVCITRGEQGCAILKDGEFTQVPGFRVQIADTVGAGDAFATGFVHGLSQGWSAQQIGRFAKRRGRSGGQQAGSNTGVEYRGSLGEVAVERLSKLALRPSSIVDFLPGLLRDKLVAGDLS